MAKKKMSKKTKYTLLGIGLVAVGAGYFIAKHLKNRVAGIGALYANPTLVETYKHFRIVYMPPEKRSAGDEYLPYYILRKDGEYTMFYGAKRTIAAAKKAIDLYLGTMPKAY